MTLYYIAIVPPNPLQSQVRKFQDFFLQAYGCKVALKSPPHITLQAPFRRQEKAIKQMSIGLSTFFSNQSKFSIALEGFSTFGQRTIYIDVLPNLALHNLHQNLRMHLLKAQGFDEKEAKLRFTPHMTLANRDLAVENFEEAWMNFKTKSFKGEFLADAVSLFSHNGKMWEVCRTFSLGSE